MNFKALENYKHAHAALKMMFRIDAGFVIHMHMSPSAVRNLYLLLINCPAMDQEDPLKIESNFVAKFQRLDGNFSILLKLLAGFISLDHKLTIDKNKEQSINETAMFFQAVLAEAQGTRKNGKIELVAAVKDLGFEAIDDFVYSVEQA